MSGDRAAAEAAFSRMMDDDETRVLGLRGLFVEARRRQDARGGDAQYALEAARLAPAASWASDAVLEMRCAEHDWRGALATVERRASLGLVDKATARRHRAVLFTADALERVERDRDGALASRPGRPEARARTSSRPRLSPGASCRNAAICAAPPRSSRRPGRPGRIPDLAEVYLNLRPGDSALDRLKRAETLERLSGGAPEGRLAVARAAMEAREFARARAALEPLVAERPTMRVCLLMSDLEQAEHGATGRGREWLARAARAARDPAWIADGVVSDRWAPISPVTGRLDAFVWQAPPDVLVAPELALHDEVTADLDDAAKPISLAPAAPGPHGTRARRAGARTRVATPVDPAPVPAAATSGEPAADTKVVELPLAPGPAPVAEPDKPRANGAQGFAPAPVIFPVDHAPDDPGPQAEPASSGAACSAEAGPGARLAKRPSCGYAGARSRSPRPRRRNSSAGRAPHS